MEERELIEQIINGIDDRILLILATLAITAIFMAITFFGAKY